MSVASERDVEPEEGPADTVERDAEQRDRREQPREVAAHQLEPVHPQKRQEGPDRERDPTPAGDGPETPGHETEGFVRPPYRGTREEADEPDFRTAAGRPTPGAGGPLGGAHEQQRGRRAPAAIPRCSCSIWLRTTPGPRRRPPSSPWRSAVARLALGRDPEGRSLVKVGRDQVGGRPFSRLLGDRPPRAGRVRGTPRNAPRRLARGRCGVTWRDAVGCADPAQARKVRPLLLQGIRKVQLRLRVAHEMVAWSPSGVLGYACRTDRAGDGRSSVEDIPCTGVNSRSL